MKILLLQILFLFAVLSINAQQIDLVSESESGSIPGFILAEGKFVADILLDQIGRAHV